MKEDNKNDKNPRPTMMTVFMTAVMAIVASKVDQGTADIIVTACTAFVMAVTIRKHDD